MNYEQIALIVKTFRDYVPDDQWPEEKGDLRTSYPDLSSMEIQEVWARLQPPLVDIGKHPELVTEAIMEAMHSDLDGLDDSEKMMVESFIRDIELYVTSALKIGARRKEEAR